MNYDYGSAFSLKANLWPDRLFSAGKAPPLLSARSFFPLVNAEGSGRDPAKI